MDHQQRYTQLLSLYNTFKINGHSGKAIESLKLACELELQPKQLAKIYTALGVLYYDSDDLKGAIENFEKSVDIIGANTFDEMISEFNICCSYLIEIYQRMGFNDKAIKVASNALAIFSADTTTIHYYNIVIAVSRLLSNENNFEMAIEHIDIAMKRAKKHIQIDILEVLYLEKIRILLEQGNITKTIEYLKCAHFHESIDSSSNTLFKGAYSIKLFIDILIHLNSSHIPKEDAISYCDKMNNLISQLETLNNHNSINSHISLIKYTYLMKVVIMKCCGDEELSQQYLNEYTDKYQLNSNS